MKLLIVGDTDSYVKWGAGLGSRAPADWQKTLVLLATPALPSDAQLRAALAGTDMDPDEVELVSLSGLAALIAQELPDVVLVALRGPVVRVVARAVRNAGVPRPVMVSGLPGITIPAARKAIVYRSHMDLVVLHSRREVRDFHALADGMPRAPRFGLATLPFLRSAPMPRGSTPGSDIIFAAQAIVPREKDDRLQLLGWLAECARRHPDQRVVVKVRAAAGEQQTHAETFDYPSLMAELDSPAPANLVVEGGPMADHLANAAAVVTVSSTAGVEAAAAGIPAILLDDFGVSPQLINVVFENSGLFGDSDDLVNGRFRHANAEWLNENYLHGTEQDDWLVQLEELIAERDRGRLAWPAPERTVGGALRRAWDRKRALGEFDQSLSGNVAKAIGVPARGLVRLLRRISRRSVRA